MAVCTTRDGSSSAIRGGEQRASRFLAGAGEMVLRVRAPRQEAKLIRIQSPKCTIGASPGCTLRLRGAGLGQSQCWILRGTSVSVIRRLHGPATLNGAQFTEAPLKAGDRLQLGSVELEFVECHHEAPRSAPAFSSPDGNVALLAALQAKLDDARSEIDRLHEESRQAFQSSIMAADRADQLRDAMALANDELEELHGAVAAAEEKMAAAIAERDKLQALLTAERDAAKNGAAQREELQQRVQQQAAELESVQKTLHDEQSRAATIVTAHSEIAAAKAEWQACQDDLQRKLAAKDTEIQSLQALLDAQRDLQHTLEQLRTTCDEHCRSAEKSQAELAQACQEVEFLSQQRNETAAERAAQKDEWLQQQAELEERIAAQAAEIESLRERYSAAQSSAMTVDFSKTQENEQAATAELNARVEDLERQLVAKCDELHALQQTLDSHAVVQQKLDQVTSEYDAQCRELAEAQGQISAAQSAHSTAVEELAAQTQVLNQLQTELSDRQAAFEQAQQRLADQQAIMATESDQIAAARQQLEELEASRAEVQQMHSELQAQSAEIEHKRAEIEEIEHQLVDQRAAVANQNQEIAQWREELGTRQREIEQRMQELETREQQLHDREQMLGRQAAAPATPAQADEPVAAASGPLPTDPDAAEQCSAGPDECAAATASDESPANPAPDNLHESTGVSSVLSRLVQAGVWRDDEPASEQTAQHSPHHDEAATGQRAWSSQPAEEPIAQSSDLPTEAEQPYSPPSAAGSGEEESIESYMARLMQRVRTPGPANANIPPPSPAAQSPAPQSPAARLPANQTSPAPERASVTPQPAEAEVQPETPVAQEPIELAPRRAAPELGASLSAMRDLANSAARSAIDQHVRKHTGRQAASRSTGAVVALCCSIGLGIFAWQNNLVYPAAGAIVGGGLAIYWTTIAMRRFSKLRRLVRGEAE
jgi:chromosome segregation ATPase